MASWYERLESYVDELTTTVQQIETALEQTRIDSMTGQPEVVEKSVRDLEQSLFELERKVAQRDELTRATDAPAIGVTLIEILRAAPITNEAMIKRCVELSHRISGVQQQSISLFVCQFHLAELTADLARILVGDDRPITYKASSSKQSPPGLSSQGGGLLNEAA